MLNGRSVVLVVPSRPVSRRFWKALFDIKDGLVKLGLECFLHPVADHDSPDQLLALARVMEATIVTFQDLPARIERAIHDSGLRLEVIHREGGTVGNTTAQFNRQAAHMQVERLSTYGHENIVFVDSQQYAMPSIAARQWDYVVAACAEMGLREPTHLTLPEKTSEIPDAILELLYSHPNADGFACIDDIAALGAIHGLRTCGRMVPNDAGVIGLGASLEGAVSNPSLTTVKLNSEEMTRLAVAEIAYRDGVIDDEPAYAGSHLVELVARRSG